MLPCHNVKSRGTGLLEDSPGSSMTTVSFRLQVWNEVACICRRPNSLLKPGHQRNIIMGDLNAKPSTWNCSTDNWLGNSWSSWSSQEFTYSGILPTVSRLLHLLLTDNLHLISGYQALDYAHSDYRPVVFMIEGKLQTSPASSKPDWKTKVQHRCTPNNQSTVSI